MITADRDNVALSASDMSPICIKRKEGAWRRGEDNQTDDENLLRVKLSVKTACQYHISAHLIGMEAVVYDGADVVQVHSGHVFDASCGVLESRQTHFKVDLIQVSTVKRIKLERASRKQ